jgi:threonine dehydrogenase-like Zn-dependent dehydrogenase
MKCLQITAPGAAAWSDAPEPVAGPGEIVLRVAAVSTCPQWDLHILDGEPMFADRPLAYPYTPGEPGHEVVGVVETVGEGVADLAPGMRVAAWRDPGGRRQGAYAERVALDAEHVLRVPEHLSDAALAPLELAMCVQVSVDQLLERGSLEGKRVAIGGLGPAGLIAVQMARAHGARSVVATDLLPARRALGLALGADEALDPRTELPPPERDGPGSFDVALDTTGLARAIDDLVARTRETVAIFGVLRERVGFGPEHWWGGFALLGYGAHNRGAAERALALVEQGRLDLAALVSSELPLSRYAEGVERLRTREAVKVLFRPG